ncbi:hypothetical protein DYU11_06705 [Fibrisoma montanum]|uniref:Uncharacterized protein n=1 Tax=Fibrisoma montanum TaxID=2305895 RepID=A0A418MDY2_9BACT|nr:hypothetical protein [Fibrisoma montanum]RIV25004.1 hypothetical protein DYU11_06705 [Fibrisoma montanum]
MNRYNALLFGTLLAITGLTACEKAEDPFVDRVAAPVLVVIDNASGDGGGLTAEPVVNQKITSPVTMAVKIFELDKSGILDYKVGIDSIPVVGLSLKLTRRDGTAIGDLKTDAGGRAVLTKTWAELGIAAPKKGNSVQLTWSGEHKGQAFSRLSRIQAVE